MYEQGKLASRDTARRRNVVRRTIAGRRRTVIHILADMLSPISGPTVPTVPRPSDINGLGAEKLGRISEAPEKPSHETGPQALENAGPGPNGTAGPQMEHKGQPSDESISDAPAGGLESGEL